jgi:hypothetical protein
MSLSNQTAQKAEMSKSIAIQKNYQKLKCASVEPNREIKRGIWIYFLLLIFEGALRKWFLPGLATPLLIIRDPVALWLIMASWKKGLLPANAFIIIMTLLGVMGIYTAVFEGHGNLKVSLFGARILLLHFPLMFVIGNVFTRQDVINVGKVLLGLSVPMVLLITIQFFSPQTAWVNRGVGGIGEGGFGGAFGYYRPPATFSFTNGNGLFFAFCGAYLFYFWLCPKSINRLLLVAASAALVIAMPFSISRTLFFSVAVSFLFALIAVSRKPKYAGKMILGGALIIGLLVFCSKYSFFQTATAAFSTRFELANEEEGGVKGVLLDRYLGGMLGALEESSQMSFWGVGLGMGTNVGSMLLTGEKVFLVSEGEWGRVIGELGPLMGLAVIFLRLSLSLKLAIASYKKLVHNDLLPWMLLSFGLLTIPQAQWAQPTALGFSTIIGGLLLASLNMSRSPQMD